MLKPTMLSHKTLNGTLGIQQASVFSLFVTNVDSVWLLVFYVNNKSM